MLRSAEAGQVNPLEQHERRRALPPASEAVVQPGQAVVSLIRGRCVYRFRLNGRQAGWGKQLIRPTAGGHDRGVGHRDDVQDGCPDALGPC